MDVMMLAMAPIVKYIKISAKNFENRDLRLANSKYFSPILIYVIKNYGLDTPML